MKPIIVNLLLIHLSLMSVKISIWIEQNFTEAYYRSI